MTEAKLKPKFRFVCNVTQQIIHELRGTVFISDLKKFPLLREKVCTCNTDMDRFRLFISRQISQLCIYTIRLQTSLGAETSIDCF